MKIRSLLLAAGILLSAGFVSNAQTVDEIIASHLEAIGGAEKWQSYESMRLSGNAQQMGLTFPVTVISMRPNLNKVVVDVMGKQIIDAFDGKDAWSINPLMGSADPQKKTDEESKEAALQNFESDFINFREKGYSLTLEGKEEVEGTECYVLKLVKAEGHEEYHYLDTETYVTIMNRTFPQSGPAKGQAVETYFSDYQEVEGAGVLIAFTFEQRMDGQVVMQMTTEKVEFNTGDISAEMFAFPVK